MATPDSIPIGRNDRPHITAQGAGHMNARAMSVVFGGGRLGDAGGLLPNASPYIRSGRVARLFRDPPAPCPPARITRRIFICDPRGRPPHCPRKMASLPEPPTYALHGEMRRHRIGRATRRKSTRRARRPRAISNYGETHLVGTHWPRRISRELRRLRPNRQWSGPPVSNPFYISPFAKFVHPPHIVHADARICPSQSAPTSRNRDNEISRVTYLRLASSGRICVACAIRQCGTSCRRTRHYGART